LIAQAPVQSALAKDCNSINVENEAGVAIKIAWRAAGCAGPIDAPRRQFYEYYDLVCRSRAVDSGESDSYTVKWDQSKPTAYLQFDYKVDGKTRTVLDRAV
jgi:hypothetical protein